MLQIGTDRRSPDSHRCLVVSLCPHLSTLNRTLIILPQLCTATHIEVYHQHNESRHPTRVPHSIPGTVRYPGILNWSQRVSFFDFYATRIAFTQGRYLTAMSIQQVRRIVRQLNSSSPGEAV